jgi:CDP-glucose 4,6-dehydratase
MFDDTFRDRRVLVTGHTGFKGSWLAEWLLALGAKVTGFALPPPTQPALFDQLALAKRLDHHIGDIRDATAVRKVIESTQPEFVFHLAAQPLVRLSYTQPVETYATNVMGTVHVLDALRHAKHPCVAVMVTTDKCYENREWVYGYREEDPMGGYDPYSSSKGMAELAIAAYRRSFFKGHPVKIASARGGNVIGGGDWSLDRIVPDCMRALANHEPIPVRNPHATRPWQHVLDALSGYLCLAEALTHPRPSLDSAFNFGPGHESNRTVRELVTEILKHTSGKWLDQSDPKAPHEASFLQLSTDKANALLGWSPTWKFPEAIRHTVNWYENSLKASTPQEFQTLTRGQIDAYAASSAEQKTARAAV